MTAPRDWDKELAEIDKVMAKQPAPVPAKAGATPPAARGGQAPAAAPAPRAGGTVIGTWFKVGMGALLAGAMTQWPYANACGIGLFIYLGATGVVVLAGLWGAVSSWNRRMGLAHTVSLLVTLWGLGMAATVTLPRIGYAKHAATWFCP